MQKVLDWIKRKGDHNIVQYSRFGLPGEETDDRPPPTAIHVAPFMDDAKQFRVFGTHSQRAAVVSAGVGISAVIFVFLSLFFEFDWWHRTKGVDMSALFGLVMFLSLGILIHYYVIRGIKLEQPKFLVPFIIIYGGVLFLEFITFLVTFNHWLAFNVLNSLTAQPGQFVLLTITCAVIMLCQGGMLFSVVRCRNYLEMKSIHTLEMLIVEKSKQQFPGIRVVYGNELNGTSSVTIASQSVGEQSFENSANTQNISPPPSYEDSTGGAPPPQRTILQAREEV